MLALRIFEQLGRVSVPRECATTAVAIPLCCNWITTHLPFLSWGGTRALLKAGFGPVDVLGVLAAFGGAAFCVKLPPVTWL